jgi:hypothetical protein
MPTFSEYAAKLAKLFTATDKYHQIVNGPDNATVATESGNLPTFAKTIKDFNAHLPSFTNRKIVYVSKMGSATDNRAGISKYDFYRPFLSITAAKNAAVAGEVVYVLDGTFNEQIVGKNMVDIYFSEFATLEWYATGYGDWVITCEANVNFGIYGKGNFIHHVSSGYVQFARQQGVNSRLKNFSANSIIVNCDGGGDPYTGSIIFDYLGSYGTRTINKVNVKEIIYNRNNSADMRIFSANATNLTVDFKCENLSIPSQLYSGYSYNALFNAGGSTTRANIEIERLLIKVSTSTIFYPYGGAKMRVKMKEFEWESSDGQAIQTSSASTIFFDCDLAKVYGSYDNGTSLFYIGGGYSNIRVRRGEFFGGARIGTCHTGWLRLSGEFQVAQGEGSVRGIQMYDSSSFFPVKCRIILQDIYGYAIWCASSVYSIYPDDLFSNGYWNLAGGSFQGPAHATTQLTGYYIEFPEF